MEFNLVDAACDLPYPEINVVESLNEAKLLLPNYAGKLSETTAIFTYSFQAYITSELEKQLEKIAIVEMTHHELLGNAIYKLGGYPVIGSGVYWNGSYVNYTPNPMKYIKMNIEAEKQAILNYEKTILCLEQKDLKLLLERIILDEEIHIKIFEDILLFLKQSE